MYNVIIFSGVNQTWDVASSPTIGAYKCAHVLRKNGFSCLVVNHYTEYSEQELYDLLSKVVGPETLFIGYSSTFLTGVISYTSDGALRRKSVVPHFNIPARFELEAKIKKFVRNINDNVKFVVGGSRVHGNAVMPVFDYGVIGYAEISVVNLARFLKGEIDSIPNSYKNIYGLTLIDDKLAPEYKFAEDTMQWLPIDVVNHSKLPIEIGRGCIFKCAFCSYPLNGKKSIDYNKNVDNIISELQYNYDNYGIYQYNIVDDTFNDSIQKLEVLANEIGKLNFQPKFWCYARLDLICTHPETLEMLYKIGVREMFFGIETLDRKSGLAIGKGFDRKKQIDMIAHIKATYPDVHLHGSFIIGTPHESIESIRQTLFQLESKEIKLDTWNCHPLLISKSPTYGDKISANYQEYGYRDLGAPNVNHVHNVNWANDHLTFTDAVDIANKTKLNKPEQVVQGSHGGTSFLEETDTSKKEFIKNYKETLNRLVQPIKEIL